MSSPLPASFALLFRFRAFFIGITMPPESQPTYEQGVADGKLRALENVMHMHSTRIDRVEGKISTLERVAYTLLGAVAIIQLAPSLKLFIS